MTHPDALPVRLTLRSPERRETATLTQSLVFRELPLVGDTVIINPERGLVSTVATRGWVLDNVSGNFTVVLTPVRADALEGMPLEQSRVVQDLIHAGWTMA